MVDALGVFIADAHDDYIKVVESRSTDIRIVRYVNMRRDHQIEIVLPVCKITGRQRNRSDPTLAKRPQHAGAPVSSLLLERAEVFQAFDSVTYKYYYSLL